MDDSVLGCWESRLLQINHPAMVARYADVFGDLSKVIAPTVARDFRMSRAAVDAYQQAAKEELLHLPAFDLRRALDIAVELNDTGRINAVSDQLLMLSEQAPMNHVGIWTSVADAFEGKGKINDAYRKRMISGLEARLASAAELPDGYAAESAGNALLRVYKWGADTQNRERVLRIVAEAYLHQSKNADAGVAIAWLQKTASLLETEKLHDDAEVLHLEIESRGPEAIASMKSTEIEISVPVDKLNAYLEELIAVDNPIVALVRLVYGLILNCDHLRERVEESEQQFTFYSHIPRSIIGRDEIPGVTIGSSEEDMEGRMMEEIRQEL